MIWLAPLLFFASFNLEGVWASPVSTKIVYETITESNAIVSAIDSNQVSVVQDWLRRGHSPTAKIKNKTHEALLDRAATHGSDRVFAVLLNSINAQGPINSQNLRDVRGTPILLSLVSLAVPNQHQQQKYQQMIEILLKSNPDQLNEADRAYVGDGRAPLHQAAANGNVTILKLLLDHGAKINIMNSAGETPLHFAARFGQLAALKLLIARGAKLNEKSKHTKATPLLAAAEMGHESIIRTLILAGANKTERDIFGKTAPERYKEFVANFYQKLSPQNN